MPITPFLQLSSCDISKDLKYQISKLNWKELEVTTKLSSTSILPLIIKGCASRQWSLISFVDAYGLFLQYIPTLLNLRLPSEIEYQVRHQLSDKVTAIDESVIRMQVMFDGFFLPIHIDNTREASLVIPINNHQGSSTQFFECSGSISQILDPSKCQLTNQIDIIVPTLIDTTVPHAVVCQQLPSRHTPRLSLTVKWPITKYSKLVNWLR